MAHLGFLVAVTRMLGAQWTASALTAVVVVAVGCGVFRPVEGTPALEDIALPLERVAFGSCNHQSREQPLWAAIEARDPQLWLWMGDAIYGDYKAMYELKTYLPPFRAFRDAPPDMLLEKYALQINEPGYASLVQRMPVIGVWDDHDYGVNDGDNTYPYRAQSQQIFLDFLGEPIDSTRRSQEGVYASHTVGTGARSVKFILLDVRYNKDPYETKDGDFLGEVQWQWLGRELMSSTAAFNIIVSGIQILPQDRFYGGENWQKFPAQRERLINLILLANVKGVILLSGDVHHAEINQIECEDHTSVITEITSSGLTHSWDNPSLNSFGVLLFRAGNLLLPWDFRPHRNAYYGYKNFGEIEFDWSATPLPKAIVRIRGEDGTVHLNHSFTSHYAEHASQDPARLCHAIRPSAPPVILTRRLAFVGFIGGIVGGAVAIALASAWLLIAVFQRSYTFMMELQRRLFGRGYQKLD